MTDFSTPLTCSSTSLEIRPTKGQPPTTPYYMSDPNGHPHTARSPPIALEERLSCFSTALNKVFKTCKGKTNLLPHQHLALRMLQQQETFLIVPCDKNLGPMIIECHDYIKIAMRDHLSDTTTYKSLSTSEIDRYSSEIKNISLIGLKHTTKN